MTWIILGIVASVVACFASMIGVGGGIFMVPLMVILFSIPIKIAISASLCAMVPYSLVSTSVNWRNKLIFFKLGILLGIPMIAGVVVGAWLCSFLDQFLLKRIFGVVIAFAGFLLLRKGGPFLSYLGKQLRKLNSKTVFLRFQQNNGEPMEIGGILLLISGFLAGLTAGLLGVGGGWLTTPLMMLLFGLTPSQAVATSLFMIILTSTTGALSHFFMGAMNYTLVGTLLVSFPLGALVGSSFLPKLNGDVHKKLIGTGVSLAGLAMFIYSFL